MHNTAFSSCRPVVTISYLLGRSNSRVVFLILTGILLLMCRRKKTPNPRWWLFAAPLFSVPGTNKAEDNDNVSPNFCQPSVVQKCGANFCCLHSLTSSRWSNFKRDFTACQTPWPLWHLAACWGILATTSKEQVAALAEFLRVQDRKETLRPSMPTFEEERPPPQNV